MRYSTWILVLAAGMCLCVGCGSQADHSVVPPQNPTPLPDPNSRIEVGGDNTRPLER